MGFAGFSQLKLTSDRLILDALTIADLAVVHAEWGHPDIARMTASFTPNWSLDVARAWLLPRIEPGSSGTGCAIRRAGDGRLMGSIGMGGDPLNFGYALGTAFWGRGYGSEAAAMFLNGVYQGLGFTGDIEAGVFNDNPASARILEKTGFRAMGPGDCTSIGRVEPGANTLYRLTRIGFEASK